VMTAAPRDLLQADGAEDKVIGFDHTATLDTALRANAVQEGVAPRLKIVSKSVSQD
jgi:hypothetical protein